MPVHSLALKLQTRGNADMQDLTDGVQQAVLETGLQNGTATVFCPSATSAVTTIEYEAGALADLRRALDEIAPPDGEYRHNLRWGDGNGHAHVRAALLGPSLTVPFVRGRLTLGTWQQIVYIDFDNRPRTRELVVQVIGD
jgi:secondary thiamine-phosphate synthase enzyme